MIGFPLGLLYANAGEWFIHKRLLHDRGRDRQSAWSFHFYEHHRESRLNGYRDRYYERSLLGWHAQSKEALGLAGLAVAHLPLLPVAPFFTGGVLFSIARYYHVHKKSHQEPEWAREHLPWHYDHHMGPNQHANWCVTWPFFDYVMGTREPYIGTEREAKDQKRREAREAAKRAARAARAERKVQTKAPPLGAPPAMAEPAR
jgi:sterol desaturase/sphingolipid hydroxylase (fatty acid hydroxylase superfamily)